MYDVRTTSMLFLSLNQAENKSTLEFQEFRVFMSKSGLEDAISGMWH